MFRRVALITFANILVRNQILLKNKQMICRHLTFTFPEHPLRVFFYPKVLVDYVTLHPCKKRNVIVFMDQIVGKCIFK